MTARCDSPLCVREPRGEAPEGWIAVSATAPGDPRPTALTLCPDTECRDRLREVLQWLFQNVPHDEFPDDPVYGVSAVTNGERHWHAGLFEREEDALESAAESAGVPPARFNNVTALVRNERTHFDDNNAMDYTVTAFSLSGVKGLIEP